VPHVEQKLLTLRVHMPSPPIVNAVRVAQSLVLFELFCK
jgi:hypothetical protein